MATENQDNNFFKKEITLGQLIGFIIGIITLLGANWWSMAITSTRNDARISALEENTTSLSKLFKEYAETSRSETNQKFQRIDDKLEVIIIKVENKKDK